MVGNQEEGASETTMIEYEALQRRKPASASIVRIEKYIVIEIMLHTFTSESANRLGCVNVALEAVGMRGL